MMLRGAAGPRHDDWPMTASAHAQELARKLEDRSATIAVVGLGYVGLPLVRAMHGAGFRVLGFGIENFSLSVLKEFNKARIHPHIRPVLEKALEIGITPFLDMILTSPRGSLEDLGLGDILQIVSFINSRSIGSGELILRWRAPDDAPVSVRAVSTWSGRTCTAIRRLRSCLACASKASKSRPQSSRRACTPPDST